MRHGKRTCQCFFKAFIATQESMNISASEATLLHKAQPAQKFAADLNCVDLNFPDHLST